METNESSIIVEEFGTPTPPPPAAPAPVAPPPSEPAAPEDPGASAPPHDEPPPDKPDAVQKRIDRLIWEREEARREAAYLRGKAEAAAQPQVTTPVPPSQPPGAPQEEDYPSHAAYVAALVDYQVEHKLQAQHEAQAEQAAREAQQRTVAEQHAAIQAREAAILQEHPDYYERCSAVVRQVAPHVKWAIEMTGAHGPDLVLYLHEHPEEVPRLNQTPPHALGIELGMLRASAHGGPPPARPAPPPAPPKPEPPTPLAGGGRTVTAGYREDMTQAEFDAWWHRTSKRR